MVTSVVLIVLLISSNVALITYLSRKERTMTNKLGKESNVYLDEKCKLIAICTLFSMSCAIDCIYNGFAVLNQRD